VNALNAVYTPTAGEIALGSLTLTLTTTPTAGPGVCTSESDNVAITFTPSPTVDAGAPQSVCANDAAITLNGSMTVATGGVWTGGAGTYVPNANALNAVYTPSAAEITAGTVTLTLTTTTGLGNCTAVSDNVTMTITPAPVVEAGSALTSCANNADVTLAGSVTLASGGTWSGGAGTYNPDAATLNAVYTPSASEITAGTAKLYLTSDPYLNCTAEKDSVVITIQTIPVVNAGLDQTICVNNLTVNLAGSVSGNTNTGKWSTSGSGFFVPNDTTLNATYKVSSADSLVGSVTLTLTSTNSVYCLPVSDDMVITILPAGVADAGNDQTVCANNANVTLNGVISGGATKGTWTTTGTGAFTPNDTTLNATYLPSAFDKSNGSVTLRLTANSCNTAVSEIDVTITPAPLVNAGADKTICASNLNVSLVGSVTGASITGKWTTLGSGTFDDDESMTPVYTASLGDSLLQGVNLVLTATNIGNCATVTDTVHINIYPTGGVIAGNDQTLCANNGNVSLNGVITGGATSGKWTTSGSGVFTPNDTTLNAVYIPSSSDTANGIVNLTLTATNSCNVAADFLIVTYTSAPIALAGNDDVICVTNPNYTLNGSFIGSGGAVWTTSGTGTFSPNNTTLNATYIPTAADISAGSVILKLTTTGNGTCNAEADSLELTYSPGVTVDAGQDQLVCSTSLFTILQGNVSNGSTTGVWTTLGTGTFAPDSANLGAEYHFSAGDLTAGSVRLVLTSTNNGSCLAETDTMEIVFGSTVYTDAGADQTVCESNMDVTLNGFVSGGSTTGKWFTNGSGTFSPNDTTLNAIYTPSATDSINGTVELRLVSTNNGGCAQGTDTMEVTIEANPIVDAGTDISVCASVDSINLLGVVSTSQGKWSTSGSGFFVPNDTTLSAIYVPSLSDIAVGSWKLVLTSAGNTICNTRTDTLNVTVVDALDAAFTYVESCIGKPMSFTDSTIVYQGTISGWEWDFGDGNTSTSQNPFNTFTTVGPYDVKLIVTSSLGCKDSLVTSVLVNTPPVANFTFDGTLSVNDPVQFTDGSSIDVVNWEWDFNDGSTSVDKNPLHTYLLENTYEVELIVSNQYGCSDTILKSLEITNEIIYRPVTPTAFSPNGDGENDVLYIRGGPFLELYWAVYNQWGNLIYEGFTDQDGWDGKWKGKIQPNTDYVVVIKATTVDGVSYNESNSISLIR
ncbi:MAG: PKD domain-containing protein, partial [Vicingus serpentipes]|nr:PKD domain-containing protein [Vicingus serpentipes]